MNKTTGILLALAIVTLLAGLGVALYFIFRPATSGTTTPVQKSIRPTSSSLTTLVPKSPAPVVPRNSKMALTVVVDWGSDTPVKLAQRLGFPVHCGGFYNHPDQDWENTYRPQVTQLAEMRDRFGTPSWDDYVILDIAILPRGGFGPMEQLFPQIARSIKWAFETHKVVTRTRYCTEMNGTWFPYGQKEEELKATMRKFYTAVKSVAPSPMSIVMFNPNFSYQCDGPVDARRYDPGPNFYDCIGADLYRHGDNCKNVLPTGTEIADALRMCGFADFVKSRNKPFLIGETSKATKMGCPMADNFDYESKANWIRQLFNPALRQLIPQLHSISWFDYRKNEDGEDRDFRFSHDTRLIKVMKEQLTV